ncbi:MAG: DUF1232 domain-containing protein [Burkholderiales bacterium]|nr:DUF1232 domain-containing protein [Burkholderiales bacterium]MDE2286935.1 DUF1232 domain-containing protein [Burkholderiales bacterium]MDE2609616.1 DUF1232 domain-containing protein [Burkholderiales bacterium]
MGIRILRLWRLARTDFRVLRHALRHPDRPRWLWPAMAALALYAVWPFDPITVLVPVLGLLDDVVVIALAVHWLLKLLPSHVLRAAQQQAGMASRA